jgi:hypothetical protein
LIRYNWICEGFGQALLYEILSMRKDDARGFRRRPEPVDSLVPGNRLRMHELRHTSDCRGKGVQPLGWSSRGDHLRKLPKLFGELGRKYEVAASSAAAVARSNTRAVSGTAAICAAEWVASIALNTDKSAGLIVRTRVARRGRLCFPALSDSHCGELE